MSKDFDKFKRHFKGYQERFSLGGYRVYYEHTPIDTCFAAIQMNHDDMAATVRLNSKLPDKEKPHKNIKLSAKHEALHLLCGRLEGLARYRYSTEQEIGEASEELVHKLEQLIED